MGRGAIAVPNVVPLRRSRRPHAVTRHPESEIVKPVRFDVPVANDALEMQRISLVMHGWLDEFDRSMVSMHRLDIDEASHRRDTAAERYHHQVKTRAIGVAANKQLNAYRKRGGTKKPKE